MGVLDGGCTDGDGTGSTGVPITSVIFGSFEVTLFTCYETKALQQYKWREYVGTVDISLAHVSIIQELDNPGVIE